MSFANWKVKISFYILLATVFLSSPLSAQMSHIEVRDAFPTIVEDEHKSNVLAEQLTSIDSTDYFLTAYRGAINIVLADYADSPRSKMDRFNSGKKRLGICN